MSDKFQVGDRVYIERGWNYVSGPFIIEKKHKGNGNFIVDGDQYKPSGYAPGNWSQVHLVLATPEFEDQLKAEMLRRNIRSFIAGEKFNKFPKDAMMQIRAILQRGME